ncbi:MAG: hypothetical protein KDD34_02695 [Bdellovibrionales bacterium]|nr:hypothetical protein [Bdellovibrionales bacterium]
MTNLQKTQLFYQILRGALNPNDVSRSVKIGNIIRASGLTEEVVKRIKAQPGGVEFFSEKRLSFNPDFKFYSQCPPESLGRVYFNHLTSNGLNPNDLDGVKVMDDLSFLGNLMRQVHDIWHVVTGFDTSISGEIGLQAFQAKQLGWPFSMVAIGGGCFITLFKAPEKIEEFIDQISLGQALGEKAKLLILVDWNLYWETPIDEVKTELGFNR